MLAVMSRTTRCASVALAAAACVAACGLFPSLGDLTGQDAQSDVVVFDASAEAACDGWIECDGSCVDPTLPTSCNGCVQVCATGLCGTKLVASLTTKPALWTFNGSAVYNAAAGAAKLVPTAKLNTVGSFIYPNRIAVDSFTATFDFRMTLINGGRFDGMGFMLEQTGPSALGATQGGGLGIAGLGGYGVEFDVYDNGTCGDNSTDHIGIDDLTVCSTQANPTSLFATADLSGSIDLADGQWHSVVVTLLQGSISVAVDTATHISSIPLPIEAGATYYFGFGGAIGGGAAPDAGPTGCLPEVRNVNITFPTPRCL